MEHFTWSPDGTKLAFAVRTTETDPDAPCKLWILDIEAGAAAAVQPEQPLNCILGQPFRWLPDSRSLVIKRPIGGRGTEPPTEGVPISPTIQESKGGTKAAVRTYPNLLARESDEVLFRHYTTCQLVRLELQDSSKGVAVVVESERAVGPPAMTKGRLASAAHAPSCAAVPTPTSSRFG